EARARRGGAAVGARRRGTGDGETPVRMVFQLGARHARSSLYEKPLGAINKCVWLDRQRPTTMLSGVMKHVLSLIVRNKAGVMSHVSGLFTRRGFNIHSIAVGVTEDPARSVITIVLNGDENDL